MKITELAQKYTEDAVQLLRELIEIPEKHLTEDPLCGTSNHEFVRLEFLKQKIIELGAVSSGADINYDDFGSYIVNNTTSTAIFTSTDQLGIILIKEFAKTNKEQAIIGFDNTILAESFNLASINQNLYRIGQTAAELLYKRIITPSKAYEHIFIPISLVERASLNNQ